MQRSRFLRGTYRLLSTLLLPALVPLGAQSGTPRDPAFARDGRLVVSIDGDLWVRAPGVSGAWTRLTSGSAWDRTPAWTHDGSAVVFASDRAGNGSVDIWRVTLSASNGPGRAEQLTQDGAYEADPAVLSDGTIIFVRGRLADARLWQRSPDGTEKRFTSGNSAESAPAASPQGDRIAYIQETSDGRRIRVRTAATQSDSVVTSERSAESLAWSPDGRRIAFSSAAQRGAIYVTPLDGRYVNFVAAQRGAIAWVPDGKSILISERSANEPGYNGDPDRLGDRVANERLASAERLLSVAAPQEPDTTLSEVGFSGTVAREGRNREAFDRFAARMERTYFSSDGGRERLAAWRRLVARFQPLAVAAPGDDSLRTLLHLMLKERPVLRQEVHGRGAVSSAHPVATNAGIEILKKGGNAVDAAVAVSFALGVVEPDASGVGGYGQMLVHTSGSSRPSLIEFMARVPEEATLGNATLMQNGRYPQDGPVLAMVPGTVAAMHLAFKEHGSGRVPWAELVAPAIRAARDGFVVSDGLATTLKREREGFSRYESSRALFFKDGKPISAGDTLRNPDLAWTLEQIAKGGADGFYRGEVARRMVNDLRGKGNAMQLTDLSRYFAAKREPVSTTYRGYTVFGSAPPVSGGAMLAAQLNNLENVAAPSLYTDDAATLHAMIAAWQLVPSSRNRIADPSLWPVDISPFTSKDTARVRWRCFDPDSVISAAALGGNVSTCGSAPASQADRAPERSRGEDAEGSLYLSPEDTCTEQNHALGALCRAQGTTAFVVADSMGNVVAVTQTLGTWGGNFYVTPGLGFLYNDKLTSYGTDPDGYGARLPNARHGSTIAPTIVYRGDGASGVQQPVLAVGAAGNAWITSAVYQTLTGILDFGLGPQRALELPRFLPSRGGGAGRGAQIDIEDGLSPSVLKRLESMGYRFNLISLPGELRMGYASALVIDASGVTAGADPRRSGFAAAIP